MSEKTQQIEKRIRELCPELMELSFGCVLQYGDDYPNIFISPENDRDNATALYTKNDTVQGIEDIEEYEIIGHEITLSHLLRAIMHHCFVNKWTEGEKLMFTSHDNDRNHVLFDLTKSVHQNLEENEDLREFSYQLICEK